MVSDRMLSPDSKRMLASLLYNFTGRDYEYNRAGAIGKISLKLDCPEGPNSANVPQLAEVLRKTATYVIIDISPEKAIELVNTQIEQTGRLLRQARSLMKKLEV